MTELSFSLDFDVTLFTREVNSLGVVNLAHGKTKRYDHISANRLCPIKIEKYLKRFDKYIKHYHIVNRVEKHVWQSAFSEFIPYKDFYAYKSNDTHGNISIYHEMNPVGIPNPPRWLIKDQTSWVSAGDYLVDSVSDEVEQFVFSGPVEEMERVADFLDYLGTPSFRFLSDPVVLVPSGSPDSVFEQEVKKMSEMMEWVSAGEYWMGGAVMRHKEDSCECPSCSPELLPDLLVS